MTEPEVLRYCRSFFHRNKNIGIEIDEFEVINDSTQFKVILKKHKIPIDEQSFRLTKQEIPYEEQLESRLKYHFTKHL